MRRIIALSLLCSFAVLLVMPSQADEKFDTYKSIYSGEMDKIVAQYSADMDQVNKAYVGYLDAALKKATDKGDLKGYRALEGEKKRVQQEKTIPKGSAVQDLTAKVEYRKNAAIIALSKKYASGLNAHKIALMKAKDLDGAELVQAEIDRVQFEAGDLATKLPKPKPAVHMRPQAPSNIAAAASIEASSEHSSKYRAVSVADGVTKKDGPGEWAAKSQVKGAWIKLSWKEPHTISKVVLFDRPNGTDWIREATLQVGLGKSVKTGTLPNDGSAKAIEIKPHTRATWIKLTVDEAVGRNIGLAEFQVFAY
jgi:hypothetical protein